MLLGAPLPDWARRCTAIIAARPFKARREALLALPRFRCFRRARERDPDQLGVFRVGESALELLECRGRWPARPALLLELLDSLARIIDVKRRVVTDENGLGIDDWRGEILRNRLWEWERRRRCGSAKRALGQVGVAFERSRKLRRAIQRRPARFADSS